MSIAIDPTTMVPPAFLGIPWKQFGTMRDGGMDCIGLAITWFREQYGIEYPYDDGQGPLRGLWHQRTPRRFIDALLEIGRPVVRFGELRTHDLVVVFNVALAVKVPTGMGVVVGDGRFVLTVDEARTSYVAMLDEAWKARWWGGIRLTKVVEAGLSVWD